MTTIKQLISLIISLFAFIHTFYTISKLIVFLSPITKIPIAQTWIINLLDNKSKLETAIYPIIYDVILIICFILQHSLMKSEIYQKIIRKIGLDLAERAIYCLASSYTLLYLINNWKSAPTIVAWQYNVEDHSATWWALMFIHGFSWMVIYGGSIIFDLPELIGIKQVYYDMKGNAPPILYKTMELRRLYGHVRHPSFTCLIAILWITNSMCLDRLFLALLLTSYMYIAWSTDLNDVTYINSQYKRKQDELKNLLR